MKERDDTVSGHVCEFCNAPATSGGSGPGWQRFWCQPCAEKFGQLLKKVYEESPKPADRCAYAGWVEKSMQEAARRMRGSLA
jgi:transposase-like protein